VCGGFGQSPAQRVVFLVQFFLPSIKIRCAIAYSQKKKKLEIILRFCTFASFGSFGPPSSLFVRWSHMGRAQRNLTILFSFRAQKKIPGPASRHASGPCHHRHSPTDASPQRRRLSSPGDDSRTPGRHESRAGSRPQWIRFLSAIWRPPSAISTKITLQQNKFEN
jgi:hypothetical protein